MGDASTSKELQQLVSELRTAVGENLASVILYGSSATSDQSIAASDHNVLVVLKRAEFKDLVELRTAISKWSDAGQPPPVLFTVDELARAADVFPIEFLQMQRAHQVLHGSDALESIDISPANLRHQTEYELRTKFIQLRRLYIFQTLAPAKLSALMLDSFSSFAALFRAVLILHGEEPPISNAGAVQRTVALLGLEAEPFDWILKRKAGDTSELADRELNDLFASYIQQIERVIAATDRMS
jgi:hypothetical protein